MDTAYQTFIINKDNTDLMCASHHPLEING